LFHAIADFKQFVFANIYKEQFFLFAKVVKMTITL